MIIKTVKYPWGAKRIYYENFILKIVDETINKTLLELTFYGSERELDGIFNALKSGHYENEVGFVEYNSNCFEYVITIQVDKNKTEEHKILVYRMGFLKV